MGEAAEPAISRQDAAREARKPVGDKLPSESVGADPDGSVRLRRVKLVHGTTTGEPTDFRTRGAYLKDRQRAGTEEEVLINARTVENYRIFLNSYVEDLASMSERPDPTGAHRNALEAFLASHERQSTKLLVDLLTDQEQGTSIRRVSEKKLQNFLFTQNEQQEQHWALTTMLMEEDAVWTQAAVGIDAVVKSHKFNKQARRESLEGKRSTVHDRFPNPRRAIKTAYSTTATVGGAAAWWLFGRGSQDFKFTSENDMLQQMKANASPAERLYLRLKTGIDLDRIDGNGDYNHGYQPDVDAIQTRLDQNFSTRNEFLRQLSIDERPSPFGMDRGRRIRTPSEFIANYHRYPFLPEGNFIFRGIRINNEARQRRPEGLITRYSMDVMHEFDDITDAQANPHGHLTDTRMVDYIRLCKAYERVKTRFLQQDITLEEAKRDDERQKAALQALKEKRAKMDNPEEFRAERRKEHIEAKKKAEERKAVAETKRKKLMEDEGSLGKRETAVRAVEGRLTGPEFGVALSDNITNAVEARITLLRGEVRVAHAAYLAAVTAKRDASTTFVRDEVITPLRDAQQDLARALQDAATRGMTKLGDVKADMPDVTAVTDFATRSISEAHDVTIAPLKQTYEELNKQLTDLQALQTEYQRVVHERNMATEDLAQTEPLQTAAEAHNTFLITAVTLPGAVAAPLTEDQINEMTVQQLADALGTAVPPIPGATTPEERINFSIQAKAQEQTNRTARLSADESDAIVALSALIPPVIYNEIILLRPNDLYRRLVTSGVPDIQARIYARNAYEGVSRQLRTLAQARIAQEVTYYDSVIKNADKALEGLDNLEPQKAELDESLRIIENQLELYDQASNLADDDDALHRLFNVDPVNTTDPTLTEAERTAEHTPPGGAGPVAYPQGMYEWYRLIDRKYTEDTDRERSFQTLQRILPPDRLALLLGGDPADSIDVVFSDIDTMVATGGFNTANIQQQLQEIINYVRDHALAI